MEAIATKRTKTAAQSSIPEALIYEIMDGKPIYRRGYRDVLNQTKTIEEIMGASTLQGTILVHLLSIVLRYFDEENYVVLTGEPGIHLGRNDNLAGDLLIFDSKTLPSAKINRKYADVPAQIVIEIDVDADTSDISDWDYIARKTQKLLDFGTQKVIWIFTNTQLIVIAEPGTDWQTRHWDKDVEIGNGAVFNIAAYLRKRGIVIN